MGVILRSWQRLTPRQQEIVIMLIENPNAGPRELARMLKLDYGFYCRERNKIKKILDLVAI